MPVVDVHSYVMPAAELIYERATADFRGNWERVESYLGLTRPLRDCGDWASSYLRLRSGEEEDPGSRVHLARPTPVPHAPDGRLAVEPGVLQDDPLGRLRALDRLGIDVQLISPGPSLDAIMDLPSNLAAGYLAAYNRYLLAYCEAAPERLKSVVQVYGGEPHWSAREIHDLASDPSVAAVTIYLPVRVSPDDRNFAPIWQALEETGLPLLHRPGCATQVWTPPRLASYLVIAGIFERYQSLAVAVVGATSPWLAAWLRGDHDGRVDGEALGGRLFVAGDEEADDGWLLWQSEFPFGPDTGAEDRSHLPRAQRLSENARAYLGLAELREVARR